MGLFNDGVAATSYEELYPIGIYYEYGTVRWIPSTADASPEMQLVEPTDFEILAFLDEKGRNNAINISTGLSRDRSYVNTRLRALAEKELIQRVGPAENSGLYELTDTGRVALSLRDRYADGESEFGELLENA